MDNTPSDNKLKKYIHIGIHYHTNNYYRKKRNYSTRLLLTDFQDITLDSSYTDNYFNIINMPLLDLKNFETYFEDEMLIKAIKQLNIKEKRFLLEKYVVKKSDTQLAKEKEISQQAISIYKKRLLEKLKGLMKR
ncbi:sigma-70 family RNA polymerase sigma factor [Enterococcus sp. BWB1-3]|uniref:sigma-70 family RNA polymerase sigma factor n=1 Tax=Enterococcus sp. BWB1-3 TaxID=2787713 RepID=UPI001924AB55|nr:sigma-70 family RNA polymerase sigma factor [Enterococcus sp. BWB1-3]MBL1227915.1 sigma-70 family RNA polymerase sigma factor [Enterococcus sp. BWB1-3]